MSEISDTTPNEYIDIKSQAQEHTHTDVQHGHAMKPPSAAMTASTGFDEGGPGHVGHHLVHGLLTDLTVLWGRLLVPHSTTPPTNTIVQQVEVGRAGWP